MVNDPVSAADNPPDIAASIARGVTRAMAAHGYAALREVPLANGRRADLLLLGGDGTILIVEVKSSLADFRADRKWPDYWDFCDRLYFAVASGFPAEVLPEECGLLLADGFGAAILRDCEARPLAPARRKALTLRFGRLAAQRLARTLDPGAAAEDLI